MMQDLAVSFFFLNLFMIFFFVLSYGTDKSMRLLMRCRPYVVYSLSKNGFLHNKSTFGLLNSVW